MLVYVSFFILTFAGGVLSNCKPPNPEPECPKGEHFTRNNPRCIRTCANKWVPTSDDCKPFTGCVCDGGLVRLHADASGPCIHEKNCPCKNDPKNPNTGDKVYTAHAAGYAFAEAGHEKTVSNVDGTSSGHFRSKASSVSSSSSTYTSVESGGCGGNKCNDPNAVYKDCPNPCPLTCSQPKPRPCNKMCIKSGCECAQGFVLNEETGRCVRLKDCPGKKCRDPNAEYKECPNPCPVTCNRPFPRPCNRACIKYGCECAPGFLLENYGKNARCIRPKHCPEPIRCPKHAHYVVNDNVCLKTCGNRMLPNFDPAVAGICAPYTGCICEPGYVRKYDNATGPCIRERKCPPIPTKCGINEEPTSCRIVCPPQTCDSIFSSYYCLPSECEPGCDCCNGYLRNADGECIPSEDCFDLPEECGPNEVATDCKITCPPQTCESLFTNYLCAKQTNCTSGCNCIDGYLRNSLGECVPSDECYEDPAGCDGDINAVRVRGCGSSCPPTCKDPEPKVCTFICILNACECKPEFILSEKDGVCIAPEECPGGSPACGANKTYVGCKFGCPTNYCPADDSRGQVACSLPPYPCQGGCACKEGYLIVSRDDPRCVLSSDCPEVECTRPNEVWDPDPKVCFPESCADRGIPCDYPSGPRCVCKEGYYRNESDICIPESECPPLGCKGDLNATLTTCPTPCKKTCDDPTAGDEGCIEICLPEDCQCNPGYVLTKENGGVCIKLEDCPDCKGDSNAVFSNCPSACEPTCEKPDRNQVCTRQCMPKGCVCKPGYVLDKTCGKCIKPEQCPGCKGDRNATYKECPSPCPLTCADQDPNRACLAVCAKSGCECNPGYVLTEIGGKCIKPKDCPVDLGCNGDLNATHSDCPSSCPTTCENRYKKEPLFCPTVCDPSYCVCKLGYILTKKGGKCVKPEDCPVPGCNGDPNAVYTECRSACEPTCKNPKPKICTLQCLPAGCECKPGYVRSDDGICIKPEECPGQGCNGDPNAVYTECRSACEPTCKNPKPEICTLQCLPAGCECKSGYVRSDDGICIKPEECPGQGCNGDPNAVYSKCPSACEPTCTNNDPNRACTLQCLPPGCICKSGYVLSEECGKCIKPEECPGCNGDMNATYTTCTSGCPLSCATLDAGIVCAAVCHPPGCKCNQGYVLGYDGKCILPEDCPEQGCNGDPNAVYTECRSACEPTCKNPKPEICTRQCLPAGCECKSGYVRSDDGICIKPEECPGQSCNGDPNAVYTECRSACEPTCKNPKPEICTLQCLPAGCECKSGYVRSDDGICIKPEECPVQGCNGDMNATYTTCTSGCPLSCATLDAGIVCAAVCHPPGCKCNQGYVLGYDGKCILPEDCPEQGCNGDSNAMHSECPSACEPTCKNPRPEICTLQCLPPGCICKPGYVLSKECGKCIKPEECPAEPECKGDRNATFTKCPSPCQATCKNPDTDGPCIDMCMPPGCVCKPGYLLKKKGGKCIRPEDCPGGSPRCGKNETYVYCKVGCPTNYCPVDDSRDIIACDPIFPCPGGCACKEGYLMLSEEDDRCILSSDCPPVECTRKNEVWDPYAPGCLHENCYDKDIPCDFQYPGPPRCVCIGGFYRNDNGECVPEALCPPQGCNGDMNATFTNCTSGCPPSCKTMYDEIGCAAVCNPPGCQCNPGYVLDYDGKCILPEDCPAEPECKGDRNATFKECPSPCQATCKNPDTDGPCIDMCLPPGCVCKPGYLKNKKGGKCIRPEDCPGGSPRCGKNETYVYCKVRCLTNYCPVDDSRDIILCDPMFPCPGGCACKDGYLMLSEEDDRCVLASDCPPVECTRPNEKWDPNASGCLHESCDNKGIPCDFPYPGPPRCVCIEGFYRNKDDICVPEEECPPGCGGDTNATYTECTTCPLTCKNMNSNLACPAICYPPGCQCKQGYVQDDDGKCILPEDCPEPEGCNGDMNATYTECTTCQRTCDNMDSDIVCAAVCYPPGCQCNPGYVLGRDGKCILPQDCPGPEGCNGDMNATYTECTSACPRTCKDKDPNVICPAVCKPPGCQCNPGYVLGDDGKCILPEDCPAPEGCCGDLNATFSECPSQCPATCCHPDSDQPCITSCAEPGCVCNEGYILSEPGGHCISPYDCPGGSPTCCGNTTYVSCKIDCLLKYCPVGEHEDMIICDPIWPCPSGCECKPGYLMTNTPERNCILAADCPPVECTGPYEEWDPSPPSCNFESCEEMNYTCDDTSPGRPRCVCKEGYYRDQDGVCIPAEECPDPEIGCNGDMNATFAECPSSCPITCENRFREEPVVCAAVCDPTFCACKPGFILTERRGKCIKPEDCPAQQKCGYNEVAVPCRQICPPQNCEIAYTDYACTDESKICEPGCDCLPNHLRNGSGICIPNDECPYPSTPVCGINEIARDCRRICPPQSCLSKFALFRCKENIPCEPGCDCVAGYLRDDTGKCIRSDKCPGPQQKCGYNEVAVPCRQICPPQNCEIAYTDYACTDESKICEPGCDCLPNHLRNGSGICIPNDECPYPSTPVCGINEIARDCRRICPPQSCLSKFVLFRCKENIPCEPGCDCVAGYLRDDTGKCIRSDKCPGPQQKCGYNEVAVPCRQICPPQNCEIAYTDYACTDESKICEPGCDCLPNHLRNGSGICIPNDECPYPSTPVCGINEIARDCRRICPPQSCLSKYALFNCKDDIPCEPGCDCVAGYLRDYTGKCIRSDKCPGPCSVTDECKRTCEKPNPLNCPYEPPSENINGCDCKDGYILSELGGDCIPIDECPADIPCHGDSNARPKRCPRPCPSTCQSPNQLPCKRMCEAIACECKPGFLLSNDTGRCILPNKCPGGNPCGPSGRFVDCKADCKRDYCPVDDSRDIEPCEPPSDSCLSGCICGLNHKKRSRENPICIVSSDCPPINCTRPDEIYDPCPSACLRENCEDVNDQPTVCNTLVLNCEPACICKKNYFRNSTGICIPAKDCPC